MKILIPLLFIFPVYADNPSEEVVKEAQNKCSYQAMVYSTTQQVRQDYMLETGRDLSWSEFLISVANLNFKKDEGLIKNLKMSQLVFTYIPPAMPVEKVAQVGFDTCWKNFLDLYASEAI